MHRNPVGNKVGAIINRPPHGKAEHHRAAFPNAAEKKVARTKSQNNTAKSSLKNQSTHLALRYFSRLRLK